MLSRTLKGPLALVSVASLFAGCVVPPNGGSGYTKDEARELGGIDPQGNDICAAEGWYDDNECDDFCPEVDPDCPVSNCPDPNDPAVEYHGEPGSLTCAQEIDFCAPDKVMFNSPECGCGCILPQPPGESCGGFVGALCGEGEFCEYPLGAQCGIADQTGTCQPLPDACPEYYAPVCGCDGETYGNPCIANSAGVSILHSGSCDQPTTTCGGIAGEECGFPQFCNLDYQCGVADAQGTCETPPQACPENWAPVCGCDGETYGNACEAHSFGASIAHDGTCEDPVVSCGFAGDGTCPEGEFCNYTLRDICGWADALGTCEPLPQACPDNVDPVCGCDGITYTNECEANAVGTAIVSQGPCDDAR